MSYKLLISVVQLSFDTAATNSFKMLWFKMNSKAMHFNIFQLYHAEENVDYTGFYICFNSSIGLSIYLSLLDYCDFDMTCICVNCKIEKSSKIPCKPGGVLSRNYPDIRCAYLYWKRYSNIRFTNPKSVSDFRLIRMLVLFHFLFQIMAIVQV